MLKITDLYEIPAMVIATGEKVLVNNKGIMLENPWVFYTEMWHFTEDGRVFHNDELKFL